MAGSSRDSGGRGGRNINKECVVFRTSRHVFRCNVRMPVLEASTRDVTAERTRSIPSSCQAGGRDWNQPHLVSRFLTHLAAILQQARNFGRNFAVAAAGYLHTVLPVGVNRRHEVDLEDGTKQLEHLRGQHLEKTWTANKRCETCRIGEGARWHGKGREKKHRENYYFFCRYDVEYSFGHVQTYSNVFRGVHGVS